MVANFKLILGLIKNHIACLMEMQQSKGKEWNKPLIASIFWHEEASTIQNIPISKRGGEDLSLWSFSKNELCSICSSIWKPSVLMKTRNFLWKVHTNSMPIRHNLTKRKVLSEGNWRGYFKPQAH